MMLQTPSATMVLNFLYSLSVTKKIILWNQSTSLFQSRTHVDTYDTEQPRVVGAGES